MVLAGSRGSRDLLCGDLAPVSCRGARGTQPAPAGSHTTRCGRRPWRRHLRKLEEWIAGMRAATARNLGPAPDAPPAPRPTPAAAVPSCRRPTIPVQRRRSDTHPHRADLADPLDLADLVLGPPTEALRGHQGPCRPARTPDGRRPDRGDEGGILAAQSRRRQRPRQRQAAEQLPMVLLWWLFIFGPLLWAFCEVYGALLFGGNG
jgi:hypothetical protein